MDMDTDEEMEWNVLKGDISDKLAKENEVESARKVEHKKMDSDGGNKENIGVTRQWVDEEIYRHLQEAYVTTTGWFTIWQSDGSIAGCLHSHDGKIPPGISWEYSS
jgi:hypothetical protein